jgi:hypothetical protein
MNAIISYCSPLMNRHWQLKETFAANCRCVNALEGRLEWVIVNIRRADDVSDTDWSASDTLIRSEGAALLEQGTLRYYTTKLPEWNPSWGKNLGKFLARGSFLINLDIDNFISIPDTMRLMKMNLAGTLYHGFSGDGGDGTCGMIGVPRAVFFATGGYKEDLVGYGHEDVDFLRRAQALSNYPVETFCTRRTIDNDTAERTANIRSVSTTLKEQRYANKIASKRDLKAGKLRCENTETRNCTILDHTGARVVLNSA